MAEITTTQPSKAWCWLISAPAALFWFVLALVESLFMDALMQEMTYTFNWHLLFRVAMVLLVLTWVMHGLLLPVAKRYVVWPFLGMISILSIFSDATDEFARWFGYAYGGTVMSWVMLVVTIAVSVGVFSRYLHRFLGLTGRALGKVTGIISLPCIILLGYNFFVLHDFFVHRSGTYPAYHQALYEHLPPGKKAGDLAHFFAQPAPKAP